MKIMRKIRAVMLAGLLMMAVPARVWAKEEVIVPDEVAAIAEELGQEYGICSELIQAICWRESRFKEDAVGGTCIGIMQINERWHRDRMKRLGVTDLYDTKQNMLVGADYLAELFERYEDVVYVLDAYNGGSEYAERNCKDGVVTEYAKTVIELSESLERKHGKID